MSQNVLGWACPSCTGLYEFHNGPPSSGGPLSSFTRKAADRMWDKGRDACCFSHWWTPMGVSRYSGSVLFAKELLKPLIPNEPIYGGESDF